jgi:hypothetical protein
LETCCLLLSLDPLAENFLYPRSDNGLDRCFSSSPWAEADSICSSAGARLCTVAELQTDETRGSGCNFDESWIWSSNACEGGHMVARGSSGQPKKVSVALGKPTTQSNTGWGGLSGRAVDGDRSTDHDTPDPGRTGCTHTMKRNQNWWQVDLGEPHALHDVNIYHRTEGDSEIQARLKGAHVIVSATPDFTAHGKKVCFAVSQTGGPDWGPQPEVGSCNGNIGRYVTVVLNVRDYLTVCEFEIFGEPSTDSIIESKFEFGCPHECSQTTGQDCVCQARCSTDAHAVRCCADDRHSLTDVFVYASDPWYCPGLLLSQCTLI